MNSEFFRLLTLAENSDFSSSYSNLDSFVYSHSQKTRTFPPRTAIWTVGKLATNYKLRLLIFSINIFKVLVVNLWNRIVHDLQNSKNWIEVGKILFLLVFISYGLLQKLRLSRDCYVCRLASHDVLRRDWQVTRSRPDKRYLTHYPPHPRPPEEWMGPVSNGYTLLHGGRAWNIRPMPDRTLT